ncbi:MAG TPA: hypothetical protein VF595_08490 [Tepidisphaeraceae bacterium]
MTTDPLSDVARRVLRADAATAYTDLVPRKPGSAAAGELLHALSPADLLTKPAADRNEAACLLSGLWLWHGYLDESHTVSQAIDTASGSFWHAIMHRQEGDFGNAKYWYARCRNHPVMTSLGIQAAGVVAHAPADKTLLRLSGGPWDGPTFVDFVQRVHESPSDERYDIAVALQQLEWRVLFDHCTREAAGA